LSGLSYNEAISEIKKYIQSFKWDFVREKLKKINKQIDETEKSLFRLAEGPEKEAQKTKLNQLMEQHIKLSSELR
jgi:hypothetical protein